MINQIPRHQIREYVHSRPGCRGREWRLRWDSGTRRRVSARAGHRYSLLRPQGCRHRNRGHRARAAGVAWFVAVCCLRLAGRSVSGSYPVGCSHGGCPPVTVWVWLFMACGPVGYRGEAWLEKGLLCSKQRCPSSLTDVRVRGEEATDGPCHDRDGPAQAVGDDRGSRNREVGNGAALSGSPMAPLLAVPPGVRDGHS